MKVFIFYGSRSKLLEMYPHAESAPTIVDLACKVDAQARTFSIKESGKEIEEKSKEKDREDNVVAYADDYSSLSDSAFENFNDLVFNRFEIDNLILHNPPKRIIEKLKAISDVDIVFNEACQEYVTLTKEHIVMIRDSFDETIIGQPSAKKALLAALYPLTKKEHIKPIVILLYGKTGVGKTETAKYISSVIGEPLFRKQFSMLHSETFASYFFGGSHTQPSLAKELLARESNVILFDEFDKPSPVFYSAFYQFFDEGEFEDSQYSVNLERSIIICTSNFHSEEEIRKYLGEALYSRLDAVIEYCDLSSTDKETILRKEYNRIYNGLNDDEKAIVDKNNLLEKLVKMVNRMDNVRHIRRLISDSISLSVIDCM